ncbi:MAG: response regulator [Candidatus Magasanikbacteria bacterium]|nr:response regulator [Candidatus Magasanikbacteria bacterium]
MKKKILIIEDEEFLSEMYKIKLESEGYAVAVADDGQMGVKLADSGKPDLILLDLMMPKMNGFQVLEKLKANKKTSGIKVYVLSNLSQGEEIKKGMELGADGFLVKASLTPTQISDFVHKVFDNKIKKESGKYISGVRSADSQVKQEDKNGIKILLIEDEEVIAEMYEMRLNKAGFSVTLAGNGAWGLKLARKEKFDVIVMDMTMPAMNGCDMLKHIKKDSLNHEIPIIVLSNSAQDKDIEETIKCGASNYLLKSQITPVRLISEIKKVLNIN